MNCVHSFHWTNKKGLYALATVADSLSDMEMSKLFLYTYMYAHLMLTEVFKKDQLKFQILTERTWAIELENTSSLDGNLFVAFHLHSPRPWNIILQLMGLACIH